jgi:hypothetical protein
MARGDGGLRGGGATTNQRARGTSGRQQEAAAQQEAENKRRVARGGGATRHRCNNQPGNKRGASRDWRNKRQRRWQTVGGCTTLGG